MSSALTRNRTRSSFGETAIVAPGLDRAVASLGSKVAERRFDFAGNVRHSASRRSNATRDRESRNCRIDLPHFGRLRQILGRIEIGRIQQSASRSRIHQLAQFALRNRRARGHAPRRDDPLPARRAGPTGVSRRAPDARRETRASAAAPGDRFLGLPIARSRRRPPPLTRARRRSARSDFRRARDALPESMLFDVVPLGVRLRPAEPSAFCRCR